nr:drug resistance protein [Quercus suber]
MATRIVTVTHDGSDRDGEPVPGHSIPPSAESSRQNSQWASLGQEELTIPYDIETFQLKSTIGHRDRPSFNAAEGAVRLPETVLISRFQGIPPELGSLPREVICVLVCSTGQLLFSWLQADVIVNLFALQQALSLRSAELPWVAGAFSVTLGLSVVLAGSLTDLAPPKLLIVAAFAWLTLWNIMGVVALLTKTKMLFYFTRAMQGLAVGILVSGTMSILGRVYKPGQRKTRVFSAMAAMAPFGFWAGALQGGALTAHLEWIFATNAMISGIGCFAAFWTIPALRPVADRAGVTAPTIRNFDYQGGTCAVLGCVCLMFGLTQGSVVHWSLYTYILTIIGVLSLGLFFWIETRVLRPLVPPQLWRTPGFAPLMAAYFLGFGGFVGAWQFYAVQFFLRIQHVQPLVVALYFLPNAIIGVLATVLVSHLLHKIPGTYIYLASMLAFALGPAFFLPQTAETPYWALSMLGIGLVTFGPDLSFAAASIFITSNVPRSYQGSAGSVLVTIQNLSTAIVISTGDAIASKASVEADGSIGLQGLRAAWWFALAAAVVGAILTALFVRIPKEEEKEHIT